MKYIFRHALMQEVAYNSLLINRRKEIHEKIGRAIESLYPQRLEEFCEMLAYHYSKSGNLVKAYEYLKESAKKAVRKDALFEGVRFYKEAMGVLSLLPETDNNKREQIDLVLSMQAPWRRIGYSQEYLPMLQKAETLAGELAVHRQRLQIQSIIGVYHIMKGGDPQLGWKYLESCLEYPEIMQDVELIVPIGFDLCTFCMVSGDWPRINHVAPGIISLIERGHTQAEFFGKPFNPYAGVLGIWGLSTAGSGDFDQAERLVEKALSFAIEIDHRSTMGYVEYVYGAVLALKGDGKSAVKHLHNAIKCFEESQTILFLGQTWAWLAYSSCLVGDAEIAVELSEKGLKMHTDLGMPFWRSMCHWFRSYVCFEHGAIAEARRQAEIALEFSLENNERVWQGLSRIWLGRVLDKADAAQIEAAEQEILQGISLFEELGLRPFACRGYLWLGEVYAESGRREEALETLKKAEAIFREMGMDYWLAKAQETLARLGALSV